MKRSTQPPASESDPYAGPTGNAYRFGFLCGHGYKSRANNYKSKAYRLAYSRGVAAGKKAKAAKEIDPRVKEARAVMRAAEAAHIKENGL